MRSRVIGRSYSDVDVKFVDALTHTVSDIDGTVYRELADRTWIGSRDGVDGDLRYSWHYAHAGGVFLKPHCAREGGTWVNLLTGAEEPAPFERPFA